MDAIAMLLGLAVAVGLPLQAAGPPLAALLDGAWFLAVAIGGAAITVVAFPLSTAARLFRVVGQVFRGRRRHPAALARQIVGLAETARRQGILALEGALGQRDDPFLAAAVRLAVDGTEPGLIRQIMEAELTAVQARHARGQRLLRSMGWSWALVGGIGALVLLVLQGGASGQALGRAALPLLYGVGFCGLVAFPGARRLAEYSDAEVLAKRMVIEGAWAIQMGYHPRLIEHRLLVCLRPADRRVPAAAGAAPAPVLQDPPLDERGAEEVAAWVTAEQAHLLRLARLAVEGSAAGAEAKAAMVAALGRVERGEMPMVRALPGLGSEIHQEVFSAVTGPPPKGLGPMPVPEAGFGFEDIAQLTDREIQTLLREVDQRDLVVSLKGATPELRDRLLGNMSQRVRTFLVEEMHFLGHLRPAEVLAVQTRVAEQVLRLWARGQISLAR